MTLADVAHESGVHNARVLRFYRSLGYERWLVFKLELTRTFPVSPDHILDEVSENDMGCDDE